MFEKLFFDDGIDEEKMFIFDVVFKRFEDFLLIVFVLLKKVFKEVFFIGYLLFVMFGMFEKLYNGFEEFDNRFEFNCLFLFYYNDILQLK